MQPATKLFASNRPGGYGGEDLYWFRLPEKIRPRAVTYMKGRIFDVAYNSFRGFI